MDWNQVQGNWHQLKGKFKEKWGKFTDDELDKMDGKREKFIGDLMSKYHMSRDEAERQADEFTGSMTFH